MLAVVGGWCGVLFYMGIATHRMLLLLQGLLNSLLRLLLEMVLRHEFALLQSSLVNLSITAIGLIVYYAVQGAAMIGTL